MHPSELHRLILIRRCWLRCLTVNNSLNTLLTLRITKLNLQSSFALFYKSSFIIGVSCFRSVGSTKESFIARLYEHVLTTTYFQWNEDLYHVAISNFYLVISNFYMKHFEPTDLSQQFSSISFRINISTILVISPHG